MFRASVLRRLAAKAPPPADSADTVLAASATAALAYGAVAALKYAKRHPPGIPAPANAGWGSQLDGVAESDARDPLVMMPW
jgi:hypothetical protein